MVHTDSLLMWRNDDGPELQQPCCVRVSDDLQYMAIDYTYEAERWFYKGELKSEDTYEMRCEGPQYLCVGTLTHHGDNFYEGRWLQEQNGVKTSGSWSLDVA